MNREKCSKCGEDLGFSESDPCAKCASGAQEEAPERIWLPADTDADTWNVLAKNPSRNWRTGEPANNIEYVRADRLRAAADDDGWLPIETAPKDGTRILLVRGDYIWMDDWWKGSGANANWSSLVAWKQATGITPDPPTHWQPLPDPPRAWAKSRAEKEGERT